jgi:DNA modification methylase
MAPAELDALTRSIVEFDVVQPPVVNRRTKEIIGGHQRVRGARRAGRTTIPVILVDLDEPRAKALNLALNRIGGTWDDLALGRALAELDADPTVDVSVTGFGADEIRDLLRSLEARELRDRVEAFDLDEALAAATRAPRMHRGAIARLGEHRLACGDATDATAVEGLVGGRRAAMAFVDPPYNVDLGHSRPAGSARRRIRNDHLDPAAWEAFVGGWAATLLAAVDGAIYVAMSCAEWPTVARLLAEAGGHWSSTIVWTKDRHVLARSDYHRAFEPLWYGWRAGGPHAWYGGRRQSDVWSVRRPARAPLHPTMKPTELIERAITNSSRPGELVLDLFAGSGSTIIAAARTGRVAAAMEIDPWYCDVAIARWEAFTGEIAIIEPVR